MESISQTKNYLNKKLWKTRSIKEFEELKKEVKVYIEKYKKDVMEIIKELDDLIAFAEDYIEYKGE